MFAYIVILFLIPAIVGFLYFTYRKEQHLIPACACSIYISNFILNSIFMIIQGKSLINFLHFDGSFYLLYIIGVILCTIVSDFILNLIRKRGGYPLYHKITVLMGLIFTNLYVYFMWLLSESGRMTFELFIYNITTPVNTEAANYDTMIFAMLFFMCVMSVCFLIMMGKQGSWTQFSFRQRKQAGIRKRLLAMGTPIILFCICLAFPIYTFHLEQAYNYLFEEDAFIERHYVNPASVSLTWPENKQNLIYIFAESFEASSFSRELGGLNEVNLLPNLTRFMNQGIYFSDHDTYYGGAYTMPQATVTMSGMATALTGVTYKIPAGLESDETAVTIPGIISLNDLLYEQGYQEYYICGSTPDDYNIGKFYRAHGNATTIGWPEKIASGDLPEDYKVWWGYEDSKLLEFAKTDLQALGNQHQPFLYTINTNNTHRTDGYLEPTCSFDYEYPMQNAIACEDQLLSQFLDWVIEQPFYEHTTIVLVGDHLGHEEAYTKMLEPQDERRIFNLILNDQSPVKEGSQQNRQFFAGDMFPTVLSSLGVTIEGNRLGLGTNLFSDIPTLIEENSPEYITDALSKNSPFYTEQFLEVK